MNPKLYEKELDEAAKLLQEVLQIGEVKHIGRLEVAAGIKELIKIINDLNSKLKTSRSVLNNIANNLDRTFDDVNNLNNVILSWLNN